MNELCSVLHVLATDKEAVEGGNVNWTDQGEGCWISKQKDRDGNTYKERTNEQRLMEVSNYKYRYKRV